MSASCPSSTKHDIQPMTINKMPWPEVIRVSSKTSHIDKKLGLLQEMCCFQLFFRAIVVNLHWTLPRNHSFVMPLIEHSTYQAPPFSGNAHLQTIIPSFFRKEETVAYERETFEMPDGDFVYLDWARSAVPSSDLVIISHGLCGNTQRHYVLSLVHAFRAIQVDCLAWNFRLTGPSPGRLLKMTTSDSSEELGWITEHAIAKGNYKRVFHVGYSMGGNICLLYLGREVRKLPAEVVGGAAFCATIDLPVCNSIMDLPSGKLYTWHFLRKISKNMMAKHKQFPEQIDLEALAKVRSFREFDDHFTAPIMGFKNADDYWQKASACAWLHELQVPTLLVNPTNDPFLGGQCYPVECAEKSRFLYLEMPAEGGHCGFIGGKNREWWPATRSKEFFMQAVS